MNFLELTRARYSVRNYTDRLVEPEKLDYIFECVRMLLLLSIINLAICRCYRSGTSGSSENSYPANGYRQLRVSLWLVPTMRNHGTGNRMEKIMLTSIWHSRRTSLPGSSGTGTRHLLGL